MTVLCRERGRSDLRCRECDGSDALDDVILMRIATRFIHLQRFRKLSVADLLYARAYYSLRVVSQSAIVNSASRLQPCKRADIYLMSSPGSTYRVLRF